MRLFVFLATAGQAAAVTFGIAGCAGVTAVQDEPVMSPGTQL